MSGARTDMKKLSEVFVPSFVSGGDAWFQSCRRTNANASEKVGHSFSY